MVGFYIVLVFFLFAFLSILLDRRSTKSLERFNLETDIICLKKDIEKNQRKMDKSYEKQVKTQRDITFIGAKGVPQMIIDKIDQMSATGAELSPDIAWLKYCCLELDASIYERKLESIKRKYLVLEEKDDQLGKELTDAQHKLKMMGDEPEKPKFRYNHQKLRRLDAIEDMLHNIDEELGDFSDQLPKVESKIIHTSSKLAKTEQIITFRLNSALKALSINLDEHDYKWLWEKIIQDEVKSIRKKLKKHQSNKEWLLSQISDSSKRKVKLLEEQSDLRTSMN
ncbi:MAG: hypothetical protein Q4E47_01365 [Candidatus Saccharibacteria bacterium]|nr:hypothetical protein [Candidatus Saccharibacteria bacterium]